ncbi:MAG: NAD(+) diphosphatase [Spirochaetota bacterium]
MSEAHALPGPDPHYRYRRFDPRAAGAADGPVLLVGNTGVFVQRTEPIGEPSADAPAGAVFRFPRLSDLDPASASDDTAALHQIADSADGPVYAYSLRATQSVIPRDHVEVGYRELFGTVGDNELALAGRAIQIVDWDESTRFCSRCGSPTQPSADECVKRCPSCGFVQYPRLAPAMIVGIVREGRLLLGQSQRFRGRFHSVPAGFLEPGETAEECVRREVYEEVGISVRNIRYFGSQPWPYPHSFMLGFTAEYEAGELRPDRSEIVHADWYTPDELPNVPGEVSIAGRIINWFRTTYG